MRKFSETPCITYSEKLWQVYTMQFYIVAYGKPNQQEIATEKKKTCRMDSRVIWWLKVTDWLLSTSNASFMTLRIKWSRRKRNVLKRNWILLVCQLSPELDNHFVEEHEFFLASRMSGTESGLNNNLVIRIPYYHERS